MKRNILLLSLTLVAFGAIAQSSFTNVVVVLADDIGLGDISSIRRAYAQKVIVETPNIDQLIATGMSFTDAHSPAALCAPSRYSVMTGNNTYHSYAPWGVWGAYQKTPIKATDMTLGKLMQQAGYQTAFLGKWHLGGDWHKKGSDTLIFRGKKKPFLDVDISKVVSNGPKQQGFDYSFLLPAGIQNVPYAVYENEKWLPLHKDSEIDTITQAKMDRLKVKLDKDEGLGDSHWNPFDIGALLSKKAVTFIEEADTNRPFFMYYCSQAVHKPHTPSDELNGEQVKGTTPTYHLDMVKELDVQMGMLIAALKAKGVYENTLFIFTSDNGGLAIPATLKTGHNPSNIYKGSKNKIYEGGHRVPFIASWPSKIPANTISDALISGTDILATLATLTGQKLSDTQGMDSYNLLPLLLQEKRAKSRQRLLIQGGTAKKLAYRDQNWKLIIQSNKGAANEAIALFDLSTNPSESEAENLISDPKYQSRVRKMYRAYHKTRNEKLPTGKH